MPDEKTSPRTRFRSSEGHSGCWMGSWRDTGHPPAGLPQLYSERVLTTNKRQLESSTACPRIRRGRGKEQPQMEHGR